MWASLNSRVRHCLCNRQPEVMNHSCHSVEVEPLSGAQDTKPSVIHYPSVTRPFSQGTEMLKPFSMAQQLIKVAQIQRPPVSQKSSEMTKIP